MSDRRRTVKTKIKNKKCPLAGKDKFLFFFTSKRNHFFKIEQAIRDTDGYHYSDYNRDRFHLTWKCVYCGTMYEERFAIRETLLKEGIDPKNIDSGKWSKFEVTKRPLERLADRLNDED